MESLYIVHCHWEQSIGVGSGEKGFERDGIEDVGQASVAEMGSIRLVGDEAEWTEIEQAIVHVAPESVDQFVFCE